MTSDQAMRAASAGCGMTGNVNRRVITSTDEFLDASRTGGILPILVRPGAIHAELIRAHLGPLVADAVYCSLPLALRGETVADRVWLVVPMNRTGSGQLNGEPLKPGNLLAFGGSAEVAGASGAPLQCGILSIARSALERTATALGIKSHPPGEGEFRVAPVVEVGEVLIRHIGTRPLRRASSSSLAPSGSPIGPGVHSVPRTGRNTAAGG
jgi:hypothetical protein